MREEQERLNRASLENRKSIGAIANAASDGRLGVNVVGAPPPPRIVAQAAPPRAPAANPAAGLKIVMNDYAGVAKDARVNDNGEVEITLRALVRDELQSGRTNGINKVKYGLAPRLRARG